MRTPPSKTSPRPPQHACTGQRGSSLILVLILLTVMLLGSLALARITEVTTLAGGNAASGDAAMQASEVGINTGFAAVQAMAADDTVIGGWYFPTMLAVDSEGVPNVNWDSAPELTVGNFRVRYVVERLCNVTPVTDVLRQCLVKQVLQTESNREGAERPDPPNTKQFRVTVRVIGLKSTQVWTQAMITKGI
jgi:Tfp pilus assembly protein PilX